MLTPKRVWRVDQSCRVCGEQNFALIYDKKPSKNKIRKDFGTTEDWVCYTCEHIEQAIKDVREGKVKTKKEAEKILGTRLGNTKKKTKVKEVQCSRKISGKVFGRER